MNLDDLVLQLVHSNRDITAEQLNEIIAVKVKTSLNHLREKGRIVTKGGVKGDPFRYSTPPIERRL